MEKFYEIIGYILVAVFGIGWILNLGMFFSLNFSSPYRAEVIRGIGVFTPLGCVAGFLNIKD